MGLEGPDLWICVGMGISIFLTCFCALCCSYMRDLDSRSDSSESSENTSGTRNCSPSVNRIHIEENSNTQLNYPEGSDKRFERTHDL